MVLQFGSRVTVARLSIGRDDERELVDEKGVFKMRSIFCAAALAAVTLGASQVASAGFVLQSSARNVSVSVAGAVVDTESNTAYGPWFGSASSNAASYAALATQGSGLSSAEMTFVGAAQLDASAAAALAARSTASVVFLADSNESIRWIANLWREAIGSNNSASIAMSVTDIASGSVLLGFTGPSIGSGSFGVVAGRSYRVDIAAIANATGPTHSLADYNVGFFSSVPTPGAIALLGLAGLTARRRR